MKQNRMGSRTSKTPSESSKEIRIPKSDLNHFGVITVLFNPIKYKSRYELYHQFDQHMSRSGVTLLTVECIFESPEDFGLPQQKFEVTRANDPRHLQIRAPSVLWLKENLINMAVKRLPPYVDYIAWLDADIEFERLDWAHLAVNQLQYYPIVQLFQTSAFLGPKGKKQVLRRDHSFAYAIRNGERVDPRRASECYVHPGYGWAMRRSTFDEIGGLPDFAILGSGDIHFCYALINRIEETIPSGMHDDYHYLARTWGQRVAQVANNGSAVGYVPIRVYHHYHGSRVNRGYFERWAILEDFQYSPLQDLEKNNQTGLLRLVDQRQSDGRSNDFERAIVSYFRSRNEDDLKKPIPTISFSIPSLKYRTVTSDATRPTRRLPEHHRTPDEQNYIHLQDTRSGYHPTEMNSSRFGTIHEAYYPTFARGSSYPRDYPEHFPGQLIYYDDGHGNDLAISPGEISF